MKLQARVDFLYEDRTLGSDPDKFWKSTGKEWNSALESFLKKHRAVEEAASSIVSAGDSPEGKLRKLYARVQTLRNTSYEIEKTEKEEKRSKDKPTDSVDDVWKHGYGNTVQLASLFLGLARASGFESYGCWVASRSEHFFNPKFMQSERLDVDIVLVKVDGKEIYVDPGIPFVPFGLLPWNETATSGLRLDHDGGTWIRTPLPESGASQIRRSARFKVSETGDVEGSVTMTFTGLEALYRRLEVRTEDEAARKQYLEQQVKTQISAAAEVVLTKQPDWNHAEVPLQAEFTVKIPNWAASTGHRRLVPIGIFAGYEKDMFTRADRVHPVSFTYPYSERDDVIIELPLDWQALSMPPAQTEKEESALYSVKVEHTQGMLHITRQLNIDILLLEQSKYPGLHKFFQSVRSSDEQQIVLQLPTAREQTGGIRFDHAPRRQLGFGGDFDASQFYSRTSFAYFPNNF